MDKVCYCGHSEDDHGHDPNFPGSTSCNDDDCDCIAFGEDDDALARLVQANRDGGKGGRR